MSKSEIFDNYARLLEDTYGVQYDREEQFVVCPECEEPIYECDWPEETFLVVDNGDEEGTISWLCPICDEWHNI